MQSSSAHYVIRVDYVLSSMMPRTMSASNKVKYLIGLLLVSVSISGSLLLWQQTLLVSNQDNAVARTLLWDVEDSVHNTPATQLAVHNVSLTLPSRQPPVASRTLDTIHGKNGYLVGDRNDLQFHPYKDVVDLRIIVLASKNPRSLLACLQSINEGDFMNDNVSLHVWIDKSQDTKQVVKTTLEVAKKFNFLLGKYYVHVHGRPTGVQGQWLKVYRPYPSTKEIALLLDETVLLSPYYYWWLKDAHRNYDHRADISGYSLSHPGDNHLDGAPLVLPNQYNMYLYKAICPWGFSPRADSWIKFQNWFYEVDQDPSFDPVVPDIKPSFQYSLQKQSGRHRDVWTMWHIFYTHYSLPPQYTLYLNSHNATGLMATSSEGRYLGSQNQTLARQWLLKYSEFPVPVPKFGYDGVLEKETFESMLMNVNLE